MLRGVVFDMDGVIIDSHPAHRLAWKSFLQSVGRETCDEELDFILDGCKRAEILKHFLGELAPEQIAEYGNRKDELLQQHIDAVQPMPGVVEFLGHLSEAGIARAVATSASRRRAYGTLEELGLAHCFHTIVTGDDVTAGKPDPAIYQLAAERMQECPERLLAVEDAVSGVKSARAAGMRCLGVAPSRRASLLQAAGADPVIPDFRSFSFGQLEACFQ
ncbi:MAG: HAD family phosphatase [Candidatus Sulfotelmatobacter sp.]